MKHSISFVLGIVALLLASCATKQKQYYDAKIAPSLKIPAGMAVVTDKYDVRIPRDQAVVQIAFKEIPLPPTSLLKKQSSSLQQNTDELLATSVSVNKDNQPTLRLLGSFNEIDKGILSAIAALDLGPITADRQPLRYQLYDDYYLIMYRSLKATYLVVKTLEDYYVDKKISSALLNKIHHYINP